MTALQNVLQRWRAMPSAMTFPPRWLQHLLPLLLLAIGVTALLLMLLWHDQSSYKPLFGQQEKVASAEMMAVLDREHISYRIHPDTGQVLVPENKVGQVRMLLAAKGVTAQLPAGLELMDRNDPLGVSQFMQDVRFRRGLEGELAQSIMTLDAIAGARVHLALARSTSFVASDGEQSSASVVVTTKPGRNLAPEQIAAIVNMVAGSVATLNPARVSLLDQAGNLLSAHVDLADGLDPANFGNDPARRLRDGIEANVRNLLGPIIGEHNFRVSVSADVDNDKVEETVEKYGADPKVTSEATREEQDNNRVAVGVPGSLSNRPPPAVDTGGTAGATADAAAPAGQSKHATTRQFAYDRHITQTRRARGRLLHQHVAVVLAQAAAPTPKTGWSSAELGKIEQLLRNGLGINTERGDQLVVNAMNFPVQPAAAAWWQERDNLLDAGAWGMRALAVLLGYWLLWRPLYKLLTARLAPAATSPAAGGLASLASPATEGRTVPATRMSVVPLLDSYDLPPPGSAVDVLVDHLKVLAEKEPERVAEVVKQWMQNNVRSHH